MIFFAVVTYRGNLTSELEYRPTFSPVRLNRQGNTEQVIPVLVRSERNLPLRRMVDWTRLLEPDVRECCGRHGPVLQIRWICRWKTLSQQQQQKIKA